MEKDEFIEKLRGLLDVYGNVELRKDVQPPNVEKKFEVGKWYSTKTLGNLALYKEEFDNFFLQKTEVSVAIMNDISAWDLATDSEVLAAFTNYFRSNGFKDGSRFKSAWNNQTIHPYTGSLRIDVFGNIADASNGCTLFNRKTLTLATLIEEEKIMIGEHEVRFDEFDACYIGAAKFFRNEIGFLLPANPELFQKILDRLKNK
jgi:hypothetical protein